MASKFHHTSKTALGAGHGSQSSLAVGERGASQKKLKLLQKYEIIDSLVGSSREGASIKNSFLKMLLSRSVDGDSSLTDIFDSRDLTHKLRQNLAGIQEAKSMTIPDRDFRAETKLNPVLLKKFPEQEIENINMKSRFMLISDELDNRS